jgi:hypothetical protein
MVEILVAYAIYFTLLPSAQAFLFFSYRGKIGGEREIYNNCVYDELE